MPDLKTLYIVRHGKSSWDDLSLKDIDRPLKKRGINDAHTMAGRLLNSGTVPDQILSSPAKRAVDTAIIFCRVLNLNEEKILIINDLFHADSEEIRKIIGETPGAIAALMIFGHNPGFTQLANDLSNITVPNIPTCGIVKLVFNTERWDKIGRRYLVDHKFDFPSNA